MKFKLKKSIALYESFLKESETATAPTSGNRDAIIKDVDAIITSLETLSTQIAEDFDALDLDINEEELNEVTKKTVKGKVAQGAMDWLIYARRYKKLIAKMFTMKMNAADLDFAARKEKDPTKKAAMKDKSKAINDQVKELDKMIADKSKERGPYVGKVISKAKIEGQLQLLKHMSGMTDDPNDQRDLKTRMQDLKKRDQEEAAALKELEDEQKEKAAEEGNKEKEDQLRQQRKEIDKQAQEIAKSEDPKEAAKKWDLFIKSRELEIEIAKLDPDQEKAKADIEAAQKDIAEFKQNKEEDLQKIKDTEANKSPEDEEGGSKEDKPEADKPEADKPEAEKPADKPEAEKPEAEKPADKPEADKSKEDKPEADKPETDKPEAEKPADKPEADKQDDPNKGATDAVSKSNADAADAVSKSNSDAADKATADKEKEKEDKKKKKDQNESYSFDEIVEEINAIDSPILESELILEEGPSKILDFLIYARRYRKLQKKINVMKLQSQDLGFAAANLGKSAENADKKAALIDKKRMLDSQISDLQSMVNDKAAERGTYVQKALSKARIEGQIELIKHATGQTDNTEDLRDLKTRMQDLKRREQEEEEAMKSYVASAEVDAVDVKGDDELLRLKKTLDDAREDLSKIDKATDPVAYAQADLEVAQADMNYKVEKGDRDGVATAQEKVAKKQEALLKAQNDEAEKNQTPNQELEPATETPQDQEVEVQPQTETPQPTGNTASTTQPASTEPATTEPAVSAVSTEEQAILDKIKSYEDAIQLLKDKEPKMKEDTDKIAMLQAAISSEKSKLDTLKNKATESVLVAKLAGRAFNAGLTELAEQILTKEEWMLDGTPLYSIYNSEIRKAEYAKTLNESRYTTTSIKDAFSKLI